MNVPLEFLPPKTFFQIFKTQLFRFTSLITSEFSTSSSSSSQQQYCVQKDRIEFLIVIVVLLILLQIGLALFFYRKCVSRSSMETSSVYSEGSSRCSATSSAYNTCNRQMEPPVLPVRPARFSDGVQPPFTENPYNRLHHFT